MQKLKYNYFVFDGASCHYFVDSLSAVLLFVEMVRRYPNFADLVELHKIIDLDAGTSIIVGSTKGGFRFAT